MVPSALPVMDLRKSSRLEGFTVMVVLPSNLPIDKSPGSGEPLKYSGLTFRLISSSNFVILRASKDAPATSRDTSQPLGVRYFMPAISVPPLGRAASAPKDAPSAA